MSCELLMVGLLEHLFAGCSVPCGMRCPRSMPILAYAPDSLSLGAHDMSPSLTQPLVSGWMASASSGSVHKPPNSPLYGQDHIGLCSPICGRVKRFRWISGGWPRWSLVKQERVRMVLCGT